MSATRHLLPAVLALSLVAGAANAPAATSPQALSITPAPSAVFNPWLGYRFRVIWDARYIAGVDRISPLSRSTEVVEFRNGGDPSTSTKSPGRSKFDAVTLERGVTQDTSFEDWADAVLAGANSMRKNVRIELMDRNSRLLAAYDLRRCWVSSYQALSALAPSGPAPVERIVLQCEAWARDKSVG